MVRAVVARERPKSAVARETARARTARVREIGLRRRMMTSAAAGRETVMPTGMLRVSAKDQREMVRATMAAKARPRASMVANEGVAIIHGQSAAARVRMAQSVANEGVAIIHGQSTAAKVRMVPSVASEGMGIIHG